MCWQKKKIISLFRMILHRIVHHCMMQHFNKQYHLICVVFFCPAAILGFFHHLWKGKNVVWYAEKNFDKNEKKFCDWFFSDKLSSILSHWWFWLFWKTISDWHQHLLQWIVFSIFHAYTIKKKLMIGINVVPKSNLWFLLLFLLSYWW